MCGWVVVSAWLDELSVCYLMAASVTGWLSGCYSVTV